MRVLKGSWDDITFTKYAMYERKWGCVKCMMIDQLFQGGVFGERNPFPRSRKNIRVGITP